VSFAYDRRSSLTRRNSLSDWCPVKTSIFRYLILFFFLSCSLSAQGQSALAEPNWDRNLAVHSANSSDNKQALKVLYQLARDGDNEALLASLKLSASDTTLSAPARDWLLFSFALGLSEMDANSVNTAVLDFLSSYEVRTLVPHDDFPNHAVPLFNVPAATAGVRNLWQRQLAADKAQQLLDGPVDAWIAAYLAAGPADRRGFVDSLEFASIEQLQLLGWSALAQLEKQEDLTVIAARASLESGDLELLQQTINRGSGPEMPRILAAAALEFSPEQSGEVLNYLLHSGSDSKAALAIALLAPGRLGEENIREMLFSTLPKQNLGAAAALVLGASKDKQIQQRLSEIAAGKAGPAQQRAALAISTHQPDMGAMQ